MNFAFLAHAILTTDEDVTDMTTAVEKADT